MKQRGPDLLVYDFCIISHSPFISQWGNFTVGDFAGTLAKESQENLSGHRAQPSLILSTSAHTGIFPSQSQHARTEQAAPALQTTRLQPQLFAAGTWGAAAAQQWAALGSPVWVIPRVCCLLFLPFCACQVSQDSAAGNSLRDLSCCFGLGFLKVLFFCSSQMKFQIVSQSWHKCEDKALQ